MTPIIYLGAINKITGEYVYPKIANKKDKYICPECNKDLILCQGKIRVHHFRHKLDSINPCHHYSNPTESQIHKDAKLLMKNILEKKIPIKIIRDCFNCKERVYIEIPQITEKSIISNEYRFTYDCGTKIADVAHTIDDKIVSIFEICNTHKTDCNHRPEPWFEFDAFTLINLVNNNVNLLEIPCIRNDRKCDECIKNMKKKYEEYKFMNNNFEKYIRIKLGQKIFPTPEHKDCKNTDIKIGNICECENCKYNNEYYYKIWKKEGHLRFNFDAGENIEHNKNIIKLFDNLLPNTEVVIHSYKGQIEAYICPKEINYWEQIKDLVDMKLPFFYKIDFSGLGTIEIINNIFASIILRIKDIHKNKNKDIYKDIYINKKFGLIKKIKPNETIKYIGNINYNYKFISNKINLIKLFSPATQIFEFTNSFDKCIEYLVCCENNFNDDEKKVIIEYNINNIEDLLRNEKITKIDKQRTLECYKYVKDSTFCGIEPQTGNNSVQYDKYLFCLKISYDGNIIYIKSLGETSRENLLLLEYIE